MHDVYCHSSAFYQDCQCKTESLMHGIIIFDVKYGQHQWETVSRASRCHFHHQPIQINQLHWSIKTVKIHSMLLYCCKYQLIVIICLYHYIIIMDLILHTVRSHQICLFLREYCKNFNFFYIITFYIYWKLQK